MAIKWSIPPKFLLSLHLMATFIWKFASVLAIIISLSTTLKTLLKCKANISVWNLSLFSTWKSEDRKIESDFPVIILIFHRSRSLWKHNGPANVAKRHEKVCNFCVSSNQRRQSWKSISGEECSVGDLRNLNV